MNNQVWYVVFETGEALDHNVIEMSFHLSKKTAVERTNLHNDNLKKSGMHWDHQDTDNNFGRVYLFENNGKTQQFNVDHTGAIARCCGPFELED